MKHGHSQGGATSREYNSWTEMKGRCHNPRNRKFKNYGARGIVVCERWRSDFTAFLMDMGRCPDGLQLDRINNDGNYEPGNCRWATREQQARNKRLTIRVEHDGERLTIMEWSQRIGVSVWALRDRLGRRGWPVAKALTTPTLSRSQCRASWPGRREHDVFQF